MATGPGVDEELVARLRGGESEAFDALARRHHAWLVRTCRPLLGGDHHAAEDVAQECLVRLHAAVARDARPLAVRPWLSVVARNLCIDQLRRRGVEPVEEVPDVGHVEDDPFDVDPALATAWARLQPRQREVLHHRELTGLRYDEIATVMGTSVAAVETLLFRARAALRREYQRAGGRMLGCGALLFGLERLVREGRGDGPAGARAVAHVAGCPACTRALHDVDQVGALLRTGELLPRPASLGTWRHGVLGWLQRLGDQLGAPAAHLAAAGDPLPCLLAAVAVSLSPAVVPAPGTPPPQRPQAVAVAPVAVRPQPVPTLSAQPVPTPTPVDLPTTSLTPEPTPDRHGHRWWSWGSPPPRPSSSPTPRGPLAALAELLAPPSPSWTGHGDPGWEQPSASPSP